jgi:hypothetical protein
MLRILGLFFLLLIVAAVAGGGFWLHQDSQARKFVVNVSPIIFKDWNAGALTHRSAAVMQTPDYEAQVQDMFRTISPHLGPLVSVDSPQGTLRYGRVDPRLPRGLHGKYHLNAKFQKADGSIEIGVVKEDSAWRIVSFVVGSPAVLEAMAKKQAAPAPASAWARGPADQEAEVLAVAEEILRIMDSEDPGATWNRASLVFQESTSKRRFVSEMKRMRTMTGHVQGRKLQGVGFMFDRPGANPPGDYAVADFVSTYSHATLTERLGFYKKEDGKWQFSAHQWKRIDQ